MKTYDGGVNLEAHNIHSNLGINWEDSEHKTQNLQGGQNIEITDKTGVAPHSVSTEIEKELNVLLKNALKDKNKARRRQNANELTRQAKGERFRLKKLLIGSKNVKSYSFLGTTLGPKIDIDGGNNHGAIDVHSNTDINFEDSEQNQIIKPCDDSIIESYRLGKTS